MFLAVTPAATETFRVTFSRKWTLTNSANTVPDHYCDAVVNLAASYWYRSLQAIALNTRDSSINAGLVNFGGRDSGYRSLAEYHEGVYRDFFGLTDGERAATATQRYESEGSRGTYIFHRPR